MKLNQSWTILVSGVCCVTTLESWSWSRLWWFTHDAWIVQWFMDPIHSNLGMRQLGPPSLQKIKALSLSTYSEHEVYPLYNYIEICRSFVRWYCLPFFQKLLIRICMIRYCTSCLCIHISPSTRTSLCQRIFKPHYRICVFFYVFFEVRNGRRLCNFW